MECQQDTTIPSPSVVLKLPLIQKECHLYLLQGSNFFYDFLNINLFFEKQKVTQRFRTALCFI